MSRLVFALAIVAAVVMLIAILFVAPGRQDQAATQPTETGPAERFAGSLDFSELNLSRMEARGQTMVQLQGRVTNYGSTSVKGATVQVKFLDKNNQAVHAQTVPLLVMEQKDAQIVERNLASAPLAVNESQPFRLDLGPIPDTWNKQNPGIEVVNIDIP